jgi:hypothetical protein
MDLYGNSEVVSMNKVTKVISGGVVPSSSIATASAQNEPVLAELCSRYCSARGGNEEIVGSTRSVGYKN